MIAVRLIGGLGNQMFQYACGRALAERLDTSVYFDLSAFGKYRLHRYGLDGFRSTVTQAPWHMTTGSRFWSVARRVRLSPARYFKLRGINWIHEDGDLSYQPEKMLFTGSVYLDGYWQSARYFNEFEQSIRDEFRLAEPLNRLCQQRNHALSTDNFIRVSLHVRRGDYVTNPAANAVHGTLGPDYYRRALQQMEMALSTPFRLIVFSDDIAWARENLNLPVSTIYVEPDELHPQIDMHLMASCDHHIIANSSFSWWGAWLNPNQDKLVIAPAQWFSRSIDTRDLVPEKWIRL